MTPKTATSALLDGHQVCASGEQGHGLGTCQGIHHYEYVSLEAVCWLQYCLLKTTNWFHHQISLTSLVAQTVEHLHTMQETQVWSLGREYLLEKEIATHSSTLAWKIPWTEEPGGLQSMGSGKESDTTERLHHQNQNTLNSAGQHLNSLVKPKRNNHCNILRQHW